MKDYVARASTPYHSIARCMECKFNDDDYQTAKDSGVAHVIETGHKVEMEVGYALTRETTADMMQRNFGIDMTKGTQ